VEPAPLNYYPLLVPLAPLVAALLTALPDRLVSDRNYRIAWWGIVAAFVVSLRMSWQVVTNAEPMRVELFDAPWTFLPSVALSIDRLAAVSMVAISGIGSLMYRYSIRYLQQDPGQPRYQTLMALCISSLLFMVASADLVTLFISWQLLSWLLCLLSHNYAHVSTAQSSFRTFITLRMGDVAFLAGIVLAYHLYGTVELSQLFERAAADQTLFTLGGGLEMSGSTAVALLIFVGAMSKSAQFPLHMWLPDSLYAPTPIHGLLHAGIINAGGFLLTRLAPLYVLSSTTLHVVFSVGLITAILGTSMMLVQNDIKKTLGYSTIGQMGYMIMECGLGAFSLAVFHLVAHSLFKATIFLNCGDVIHQARQEPKRPPQPSTRPGPSSLGWVSGFVISLVLPLMILVGVHLVLNIALHDSQGLIILFFFSWVTASHAMLTLFRIRATGAMAQSALLVAIAGVSTAYLFAAEAFAHFLFPDGSVVTAHFEAAALPNGVFLTIAGLSVLLVMSLYRQRSGESAHRSEWSKNLHTHLYLLFMNRLYLDGAALRLLGKLKHTAQTLDRLRYVLPVAALLAVAIASREMPTVPPFSGNVVILLFAALLMPLFPFHGVYVAALTRAPNALGVVLSILMPAVSVCALSVQLPVLPSEILPSVSVLAACGALYGSVKALVQVRVPHLLAYCGLALYSILWWHIASVGSITPQAVLFATSASLAMCGLFLAWDRIRVRYGDLRIRQIGGLFRPMPRLSLCIALLVMAAVGLPPYGLFFGYLGILMGPSTTMSLSLVIVFGTWFVASWYLFQLMRRLLFGPHRTDFRYDDLRPAELAAFVVVIAPLVFLGGVPHEWLEVGLNEVARIAGGTLWSR
jgi:NADH-quinone oxidoreductase subunit L